MPKLIPFQPTQVEPFEELDFLPSDRADSPDDDAEFVFGDGNSIGAETTTWVEQLPGQAPPTAPRVPVGPKPKPRRRIVLALPVSRTFQQHLDRWCNCYQCDLGDQRSQIVLARGQLPCDVLFVAEAPGQSEDAMGIPLTGPTRYHPVCGLDAMEAMAFEKFKHLRRAYTNLVACFPREAKIAGINEPDGEEIKACAERLRELVALARPRLVVFVGALAKRWWPRSVPDAFWDAIGAKAPDTCHVTHPASILRMQDIRQQPEANNQSWAIRSALRRAFGGGVVQ